MGQKWCCDGLVMSAVVWYELWGRAPCSSTLHSWVGWLLNFCGSERKWLVQKSYWLGSRLDSRCSTRRNTSFSAMMAVSPFFPRDEFAAPVALSPLVMPHLYPWVFQMGSFRPVWGSLCVSFFKSLREEVFRPQILPPGVEFGSCRHFPE